MMDSMSLIQRNRAQIQNRSNSQSVRDTIVSNQNHESQHIIIGSISLGNNRVSEQPSESCSMIDEHENVIEVSHNELKGSSGCKNSSDKENSNIRNNEASYYKEKDSIITPSNA
jgi:hypothetical protein